ncbi:sensor domain-containing protein [Hydrogenovibrio halophilus]|uniref:sensor domain-containing protein n=1 Tax=Hydrogenovibrio halophilus TaxID=373391 RepID=UPI000378C277|nr:EAL domain-containing protein [Hydrogenovibrio halophilus]
MNDSRRVSWILNDIEAFRDENTRLVDALNACESERSLLGQQVSELENEFELIEREHRASLHNSDLYQKMFDISPVPKLLLTPNMDIMVANPAARKFLNREIDESVKSFRKYLLKDDSVAFIKAFRHWQLSERFPPEQVFTLKSGQSFTVEIQSLDNVFETTKSPVFMVLYPVDFTRITDQTMRLSQLALQQLREAVMITDSQSRIISVNQAFCEITGYESEEVLGHNPSVLKSGRQSDHFYQDLWQHLQEHGWWHGEIWNKRKNGDVFPEWLQITKLWDSYSNQTYYVATFSDISPRVETQKRLDRLAFFDSLTNLPNRYSLHNHLDNLLLRKRQKDSERAFAVLFLDLDKFKEVNDAYGHSEGDRVLIEATQRITVNLRDDDYAARIGGDEFVVVLTDLEGVDVPELCQRLITALNAPFNIGPRQHFLSASIGIACYPEHGFETEDLLRRADAAMYGAKSLGRNRYHWFDMALEEKTASNHDMLQLLRTAIEQPLNVIEMHYQPIFCKGHQWQEVEALVRLKNEQGLVMPGAFIELAEHHGLIQPLGLALFERICADLAEHTLPDTTRVAVNLSVMQFADGDLIDWLEACCQKYGVDLKRFNFEVTETATMENLSLVASGLTELRQKQCQVLLDDFGTGYASLSMLRNLPVDILKIDKSFVDDIGHSKVDNGLIVAMISMARALGMKTICEGVETRQQADWLIEQGTDYMQGFYFQRPQPLSQLVELR